MTLLVPAESAMQRVVIAFNDMAFSTQITVMSYYKLIKNLCAEHVSGLHI